MDFVTRRRFLQCVGGAGLSAAGVSCSAGHDAAAAPRQKAGVGPAENPVLVERTATALGTTVSIKVLHPSRRGGASALDAAFAELDLVENLMSIYRDHSQLSRLNREGVLRNPHPYLVNLLRDALQLSRRTGGAFDVTVQPLWELHAAQREQRRGPSEAEVAAARRRIDWRRISVGENAIRLCGHGTRITLNGIAQGFAADRVAATLREHGVHQALIDTGELGSLGAKPGSKGWTVGIQHPRDPDAFLTVASLAGRCLATSGDYATRFSTDYRNHHLFDPRTGRSPEELSSVSIVAETAQQADALSTAVFVMGIERGLDLVEATPGADAFLVDKQGRATVTKHFPRCDV